MTPMTRITRRQADFSLLFITLIWGTTFVITKTAIADLPPFFFLAIRFSLAFLSLLPFAWLQRNHIARSTILKGLILGIFLFFGYALQTLGLQYTTASNAGFITGLSVVLVPFLVAATSRKLPTLKLSLGILSATIGLGLLSLGDTLRLNQGDLLVLIAALSFAGHIFLVGRYAPEENATFLTAVQLLVVALLSGLSGFIFPQGSPHFTFNVGIALLLTAVPATSLAFFVQMKMQQFTTPTHTALIFACEPVFSAAFAFLVAGEILTTKGLAGAALVLAGMLLAEFSGTPAPETS